MTDIRWFWWLVLLPLLGGALWWWLLHRGVGTLTLGDAAKAPTPARPSPWRRWFNRPAPVDASAVVPKAVLPGRPFRIQALLAHPGDMAALQQSRLTADALVGPQQPLFVPVKQGALLELTLDCTQAVSVVPAYQRVAWSGQPVALGFQITPAAALPGPQLLVDINVFIDRVCIGHLPLCLPVGDDDRPQPADAVLQRVQRVFMSYNHSDAEPVMQVARALRRFGIEPFLDRLSLEGGEEWGPRLEEALERCDTFMLFWSASAAGSTWVLHEAQRALALNRSSPQRRPRIVTHLLGPPPPAAPPPGLEALHFNDPVYAQWQAALSAQPPR